MKNEIFDNMLSRYDLTTEQHKMENIKSLDPLLYSKLTHQKNIRIK